MWASYLPHHLGERLAHALLNTHHNARAQIDPQRAVYNALKRVVEIYHFGNWLSQTCSLVLVANLPVLIVVCFDYPIDNKVQISSYLSSAIVSHHSKPPLEIHNFERLPSRILTSNARRVLSHFITTTDCNLWHVVNSLERSISARQFHPSALSCFLSPGVSTPGTLIYISLKKLGPHIDLCRLFQMRLGNTRRRYDRPKLLFRTKMEPKFNLRDGNAMYAGRCATRRDATTVSLRAR